MVEAPMLVRKIRRIARSTRVTFRLTPGAAWVVLIVGFALGAAIWLVGGATSAWIPFSVAGITASALRLLRPRGLALPAKERGVVDVLLGRRLVEVAASWFVQGEHQEPNPLHIWLYVDDLVLQISGDSSGQDLRVDYAVPYSPYDMPELGAHVVIERGEPRALAALLGDRVIAVARLVYEPHDVGAGIIISAASGEVAIVNVSGELLVTAWPNEMLVAEGVAQLRVP